MRLESLRLAPYGSADDLEVTFGCGVTVVHGPNESGKSTLVSAYVDVLCGIDAQTPYAFARQRKDLRVHASFTLDDGTSCSVTRSGQRRPNDLVNLASGHPVDDAVRERIAGLSDSALRSRFGLDHDRLVAGGVTLTGGRGDLADLVFSARAGVDVRQLLEQLRADAAGLYTGRANGTGILDRALRDRKELEDRLRESTVTVEAVAEARRREERASGVLTEARRRVARLREIERRLEVLVDSWPYAQERTAAIVARDEIEGEGDRLDADEIARLTATVAVLDELATRTAELTRSRDRAAADLGRLAVDQRLVSRRDDIGRLSESRAVAEAERDAATSAGNEAVLAVRALGAVLTRLGRPDADDPVAEALELVLPDDVVADVARLAERGTGVQRALEHARRTLAEAQGAVADLAQREPGASQDRVLDGAGLAAAREARAAQWRLVRAAWLDGAAAPDGRTTAELASGFEGAVQQADDEADALVSRAGDLGEQERADIAARASAAATLAERRRAVARAEDDLAEAVAAESGWQRSWKEQLRSAGLPAELGLAGWLARAELLAALGRHLEEARARDAERERRLRSFDAWRDDVVALAGSLGETVAPENAVVWLARTRSDLDTSLEHAAAARVHRRTIGAASGGLVAAETERCEPESWLAALACAHCVDAADLEVLRERGARHVDAVAAVEAATRMLAARHPGEEVGSVVAELADHSRESLTQALQEASRDADAAEAEARPLAEAELMRRTERIALENSQSTDELRQDLVLLDSRIADLTEHWSLLTLKVSLLADEVRAYAEAHANPVLDRAGRYLSRLTAGRFTGVRAHVDGAARGLLVVTDDDELEATALSEGTATQFYLALVLATLVELQAERRASGSESLPLLLDDVLMTFDDERADAAVALLAEIGREQQVVVLTHHAAVAQAGRETDGVVVVTLR